MPTPSGLLAANVTLLQPGTLAFRLSDALQMLNPNQGFIGLQQQITSLQGEVTTLQSTIAALQTQVGNLQAGLNYTQAEVSTGTVYLDGRTIYKRSFAFSNVNAVNSTYQAPHNIPQIAYIVDCRGMASVLQSIGIPIAYINMIPSPPVDGMGCYADTSNIYIINGSTNRSSYLFAITLWYTAINR